MIPAPQRKWHHALNSLGPDLLGDDEPNWDEVVARACRFHSGEALLGEVLLDQRVAAGIGNVYKSELAFMGPLENNPFRFSKKGYWPWMPLAEVPRSALVGMFQRARRLLQANLGGWVRTTRVDRRVEPAPKGGSVYVYGRSNDACFRCGGEIKFGFQGLQNRVTYWCADCQAP
jgi:endonuclease-8